MRSNIPNDVLKRFLDGTRGDDAGTDNLLQPCDRALAGNLATRMPPHTVSDDEQGILGQESILVVIAAKTRVGDSSPGQHHVVTSGDGNAMGLRGRLRQMGPPG
ncbi:hypothetical protein DC31_04755 [Microbacterium sp. CH12i]|nr:hypothetical protein DC31_04755 [Microbacterium sp. CH12i]